MKIDGEQVQGSRQIARELDRAAARAAALPRRPREARRGRGGRALRRRGAPAPDPADHLVGADARTRRRLRSYSEGAKLGVPIGLAVKTAGPIVALSARFNEATDENVRADLAALGGLLQRVDDWIAAGDARRRAAERRRLPDRAQPALAMTLQDLRPLIEAPPGRASWPTGPARRSPATSRRSSRPPGSSRCASAAAAGASSSERADPLDPLARAEGGEGVGEARAVGQRQLRVELEQRHEDEAAARHLAVRAGSGARSRARGRRAGAGRRRAAAGCGGGRRARGRGSTSISLQRSSSSSRLQLGADPDGGVEEVGLVEDLADRLGLVGGGDGLDLDAARLEARRPRRAGGPRGRRRWSRGRGSRSRTGLLSSSSSSALSVRSWATSTATSWIASGSGGSGFAARTRTESQP